MKTCLVCAAARTEEVLDFGTLPISSHFSTSPLEQTASGRLGLTVCRACGIVQLTEPFNFKLLVPNFDWITYREPEDHLDAVVARIRDFPDVGPDMIVGGITYKDRTTLERFSRQGFEHVWMIDTRRDLGAEHPNANIETVHGLLDVAAAQRVVVDRRPADILIARHIAEHAGDPLRFLKALDELLALDGLLVIEVPDCEQSMRLRDYTMLWEEHSLYFTEESLPFLLSGRGFTILAVDRHAYSFEDVLVMYARRDSRSGDSVSTDPQVVEKSCILVSDYAADFPEQTARLHKTLGALAQKGPIALYGAGHLAGTFVNLHGLAEYFDFVVDDTPEKHGLFLPGTGLEIVPREKLADSPVATCLFGLAPEIEDKVIANNRSFVGRGGVFYSIFAASPRSLRNI